eukprot:5178356-Lingulodinium_polyedra.AAC.1
MLLWGIGCGVLTKRAGQVALSLAKLPSGAAEGGKETMRDQAAKQARIRAKGKNMLHVSLLILLNPV